MRQTRPADTVVLFSVKESRLAAMTERKSVHHNTVANALLGYIHDALFRIPVAQLKYTAEGILFLIVTSSLAIRQLQPKARGGNFGYRIAMATSYFERVPPEVRFIIYRGLFEGATIEVRGDNNGSNPTISTTGLEKPLSLLLVSRQVCREAKQILFERMTLKIEPCVKDGLRPALSAQIFLRIETIALTPCLNHAFVLSKFPALKRLELSEFAYGQGDDRPHFDHGLAEFKIDTKDADIAQKVFNGDIDAKLKRTCRTDLANTWIGGLLKDQNRTFQLIHNIYVSWMKMTVMDNHERRKVQYGNLVIQYDLSSLQTLSRKLWQEHQDHRWESKSWDSKEFEWRIKEDSPIRWQTVERRELKIQDQLDWSDEESMTKFEIVGSMSLRRLLSWNG